MINIPTRDQTAVPVVREMVNHHGKLTNVNIGSHVAVAVGIVVERMSRHVNVNAKEKKNVNVNVKKNVIHVERIWVLNVKHRIWIFHQVILHPHQNH